MGRQLHKSGPFSRLALIVAAGGLLLAAGEASLAQEAGPTELMAETPVAGDGSATNNPDLKGGFPPCVPNVDCAPAPGVLAEPQGPYFKPSFALQTVGIYSYEAGAGQFQAALRPSANFIHDGTRQQTEIDFEAEVLAPEGPGAQLVSADIDADSAYQFDRDSRLTASGYLSFSQAPLSDFDVGSTVAKTPLVFSGGAEAGYERRFGHLVLGLRGGFDRTIHGRTTLTDSTSVSNKELNRTALNGAVRAGYEITPIITVFGDLSGSRISYDAISSGLGVSLDGYSWAASAGASANWRDVVEGEFSVGYGKRHFDAAALSSVGSVIADASLTFRPDPTVEIGAGLDLGFAPVTNGLASTTAVTIGGDLDAAYQVNEWLRLRGTAEFSRTRYVGLAIIESLYGAGAGFDYLINDHAALNADYAFERYHVTGSPARNRHVVSAGVTLSR